MCNYFHRHLSSRATKEMDHESQILNKKDVLLQELKRTDGRTGEKGQLLYQANVNALYYYVLNKQQCHTICSYE